MDEKMLDTIVSSFISELVKEGKNIFKGLSDEGNQLLKTGIKRYLSKQKDKYSHLKTLLKGNTPVYLYDVYYPLKLIRDGKIIKTTSINDVFNDTNYLTIFGDAGSGKSTLVKHLFLNAVYNKFAIPILIELRYLNDYKNDLNAYILEKVLENKIAENTSILNRLFEKGVFVFFLDGYDELNSDVRANVIENINSFINEYPENKFILTSRPYSNIEHLQLFHNYEVKHLSLEEGEIEGFIHKQLESETELAKKIVDSINLNKSGHIKSFLTNPLLLSLYILTFQSNAEIPDKKYIFYRRVIQALFSEHDSKTKLGYIREKLSGLKQEEFENILKAFCYLSYFESRFTWDLDYIIDKLNKIKKTQDVEFSNQKVISDLKSAVALWVEDNGIYSFAHRSLQEYFAALLIKNLASEQNERVYSKIIERFSKVPLLTEVQNFLSLLEEMDTLNFKKYYYLPLLLELKENLIEDSDEKKILSFLRFFANGIHLSSIKDERSISNIDINNDVVYKAIYIHLPYTLRLNDLLIEIAYPNDRMTTIGNDKTSIKSKGKTVERDYLNFNKEIPDEFKRVCFDKILVIANEFHHFINTEIVSTKDFISKNIEIDNDFVDLI